MPLYEYECEGGHRFEELHGIEDRHNGVCPVCERAVHLLISRLAKRNRFDQRDSFTVIDGDGNVIGKRFDHRPTPRMDEYYDVKKIRESQMADVESMV